MNKRSLACSINNELIQLPTHSKAIVWKYSVKEVFLKIAQNSLENTCVEVSSIGNDKFILDLHLSQSFI